MADDKQQLQVVYETPGDSKLDSELVELLAKHGFECYMNVWRDAQCNLAFERPVRDDPECP